MSDRTGKSEIWTADANGKNLRQITDTPLEVSSPQFSPDNSRIAYHIRDGDNVSIFIISAEGGAAKRVSLEGEFNYHPSWSADGEWIYFISNRAGEHQLWKIKSDGGGQALQITNNQVALATPAPDDKSVFFVKSVLAAELWRVSSQGGAEEIVPEITTAGFTGSWTMTKTGIYFLARNSDQSYKMKFYDFANRKIKNPLGDYKIPSNVIGCPETTDGTVFLYTAQDQASRLMLAELPQQTAN